MRSQRETVPLWRVLLPRLRACWHVLRGRQVFYGGNFGPTNWRIHSEFVFTGCRFHPKFTINGVAARELRDQRGDVRVKGTRS